MGLFVGTYINVFLTLVLFLLCVYRYSIDKHRAALAWAFTSGILAIFVIMRVVFESKGEHGLQAIFFSSLIHFCLAIMSIYSTLLMVHDEIPREWAILLSLITLAAPIYSFIAVEYISSNILRMMPSQVFAGVAQLYCAYLVARYMRLSDKPPKLKAGIILFCAGMTALGIVAMFLIFSWDYPSLAVPAQVASSVSKLMLAASLVLIFF